MRHFAASELQPMLDLEGAIEVMRRAFAALGAGDAEVQPRQSLARGSVRLSTMAATLPTLGYCGAKVYTATESGFSFVILLFSAHTGECLGSFDAGSLTALRTAAVSCLAAEFIARRDTRAVAVFGTGVQARAHARALAQRYDLTRIDVVGRTRAGSFAREIGNDTGIATRAVTAEEALAHSDIVVTATRAREPLFDGAHVRPGTTILAIGSAKPDACEIDPLTFSRSARVAVESIDVALHESGDLSMAGKSGVSIRSKLIQLGDLVAARATGRLSDDEITVFESVGSAVEDVALAAAAYERLRAHGSI